MRQLEEKRAQVQAKAKGIDPDLLEKYNVIKKHCIPRWPGFMAISAAAAI